VVEDKLFGNPVKLYRRAQGESPFYLSVDLTNTPRRFS
jgi:hypothetical protein